MKKIYYYIDLLQKAPLRISNGGGEETDTDLLTDSRGLPYIPGSSLTGVIRSYLKEEDANRVFGYVDLKKSMSKASDAVKGSRVNVSDAVLKKDVILSDILVSTRDGVGLDDWGMTKKGAKYDFQVVETDEIYSAVMEWSGDDEQEQSELVNILEPVLDELVSNGISFGARTTRGYGAMDVKVYKKTFVFPDSIDEWLDYNPMDVRFADEKGEVFSLETEKINNYTALNLEMEFKDSFNIRVKTSRLEKIEDGTRPDSIPLMNQKGKPVIPGTAWAGAFRHHMHGIIDELENDVMKKTQLKKDIDSALFGVDDEHGHIRSGVIFSETVVEGGHSNTIMRNAVDRYTSAPRNAALFTSQVWTGGTGTIQILVQNDRLSQWEKQLIMATIYDLSVGLVSVGGEAGIGRGMVDVKKFFVNNQDYLNNLQNGQLDFDIEG